MKILSVRLVITTSDQTTTTILKTKCNCVGVCVSCEYDSMYMSTYVCIIVDLW